MCVRERERERERESEKTSGIREKIPEPARRIETASINRHHSAQEEQFGQALN